MKLLNNAIRVHRIIKKLKEYDRNESWWWKRFIEVQRTVDQLNEMLKTQKYGDYDPFKKEMESLKYDIELALTQLKYQIETHKEHEKEIELLKKENIELLDIKDRHYKLLRIIEINDKLRLNKYE
jgi:hypothetical protein